MSCLFLSHSSVDEADALALRDWLVENGWDDLFLDLDPKRGLVAGDRWQDALGRAVRRCEGVLFVITPNWLNSDWCRTEFFYAKSLNKPIFGIVTKQVKLSNIPVEITAEFQLVDLSRKGEKKTFDIKRVSDGRVAKVTFNKTELKRLKAGLLNAGINADHFDWPPPEEPYRAPYRGLSALQQKDAGIFFGRDGQIVEALDRLRGLRNGPPPRMLVVLGASGSGKSSFMRAGLLPRLTRDDRHFIVLDTIRPGQGAITSDSGFISSLKNALEKKGVETSRAKLAASVITDDSEMAGSEPQSMSADRIVAFVTEIADPIEQENHREDVALPKPALVIPVDQAEELYFADSGEEAEQLKRLLAALARSEVCQVIVLLTIRSDAFQRLQFDTVLGTVGHQTLSLPPVVQGAYSEIILGPVRRLNDSERKFSVEDPLVEQLLQDIEKGGAKDALPLLAFTLERLYAEYRTGDTIRLEDYHTMGGIGGAIEAAVDQTLKKAAADPRMPDERASLLALLRRGLIPWLAGVDPDTRETRRKVARLSDIPEEARPVIEHLVEQRLLSTDVREIVDDAGEVTGSEITIEPAHEALLRQWGLLEGWLEEDFEALSAIEGVQRAALEWESNNRVEDWLAHSAGRLETAEKFAVREDLADHLTQAEKQYLSACRKQENQRVNQALEAQKKINRRTRMGLVAASALTFIAVATAIWGWTEFTKSKELAGNLEIEQAHLKIIQIELEQQNIQLNKARAKALKAAKLAEVQSQLATMREVKATTALAAAKLNHSRFLQAEAIDQVDSYGDVHLARALISEIAKLVPDKQRNLKWWKSISLLTRKVELEDRMSVVFDSHDDTVTMAIFGLSDKTVLTTSGDATAIIWDVETGKILHVLEGHETPILHAAFSSDYRLIATASEDRSIRLWDSSTGKSLGVLTGHTNAVLSVSFSPDNGTVMSVSQDNSVRLWNVISGKEDHRQHIEEGIASASFSPDGKSVMVRTKGLNVLLLDAQSLQEVDVLQGHSELVWSAQFSPDGSKVVTTSHDGSVRLWNLASRAQDKILEQYVPEVEEIVSAEFSSDGEMVLSNSTEQSWRLWEVESGDEINFQNSAPGSAKLAKFVPGHQQVLTVSNTSKITLWDLETKETIREWGGHKDVIQSVMLSSDGKTAITASSDRTAILWSLRSRLELELLKLSASSGAIFSAEFTPNGQQIFLTASDGDSYVWNIENVTKGDQFSNNKEKRPEAATESFIFSPDGSVLAISYSDGVLQLWSTELATPIDVLERPNAKLNSVSFSLDSARFATSYDDGIVEIRNSKSGVLEKTVRAGKYAVNFASFSPNGEFLATGSDDGIVRLFNLASDKEVGRLKKVSGDVPVKFHPTEYKIFVYGGKKGGLLWNFASPEDPVILDAEDKKLLLAIFSLDGKKLSTVSQNNVVTVWNAKTGDVLSKSKNQDEFVRLTSFSPDGKLVLTALSSGVVQIRDANSLKDIALLEHNDSLNDAKFSPDGRMVVTVTTDRTARLWKIFDSSYQNQIALNNARSIYALSPLEQEKYSTTNAVLDDSKANEVHSCDLLGGHPYDPKRVGKSIEFEALKELSAKISFCRTAIKQYPNELRYQYQLARALQSEDKAAEAMEIFFKLSRRGYAAASYSVGVVLSDLSRENELGINKSHQYFLLAAEQGIVVAGDEIGWQQWEGHGVAQNRELAVETWQNSAAKGDPFSHATLAGLYHRGRYEPGNTFIKPDLQKALLHYAIATRLFESSGDETNAASVRPTKGSLAHILPAEDVVRIWREAQAWQPVK